jgi:tetratricopeptide (TPR) repeat protein
MIRWTDKNSFPLLLCGSIILMTVTPLVTYADSGDFASSEGILNFAYHLFQEGDYQRSASEYTRYQFLFPGKKTGFVLLMKGICHSRLGEYKKALDVFSSIQESDDELRAVADYETALVFLNRREYVKCRTYLSETEPPGISDFHDRYIITAFTYLFEKKWDKADKALTKTDSILKNDLHSLATEGSRTLRKSPVAAGIFSTILPGTGKMYSERWRDGLFSFVSIGTLAGLSVYNFLTDGTGSLKGWIYAGIGGLFHFGNIYGSVVSAQDYNTFQEKRLEEKISRLLYAHY